MTAREYAKSYDVHLVGKLTRKVHNRTRWDWSKGEDVTTKNVYYVDEAGTEIHRIDDTWCIVTADGEVI